MATLIDLQSLFHGQTHQFQPIIHIFNSLDYRPIMEWGFWAPSQKASCMFHNDNYRFKCSFVWHTTLKELFGMGLHGLSAWFTVYFCHKVPSSVIGEVKHLIMDINSLSILNNPVLLLCLHLSLMTCSYSYSIDRNWNLVYIRLYLFIVIN